MKLATYHTARRRTRARFGAVVEDRVITFVDAAPDRDAARGLASLDDYLDGLPETFLRARDIVAAAADTGEAGVAMDTVHLLPVLPRPAALLDCALSPRHQRASTATLLRNALPFGLGHLAGPVAGALAGRSWRGVGHRTGNHHSIVGDGDRIDWPEYTAYLDIGPELAVITGAVPRGGDRSSAAAALAGYVIYNNASARDVQLPEPLGRGPAVAGDFDAGNGIGPLLVTPDELADPLDVMVTVEITGRPPWRGRTSEYSHHPIAVLGELARHRSLPAGTLVGMGAVPGCCGVDRDEWINPGDEVTITFDGLGTLRQTVGFPATTPRTRWRPRRLRTAP